MRPLRSDTSASGYDTSGLWQVKKVQEEISMMMGLPGACCTLSQRSAAPIPVRAEAKKRTVRAASWLNGGPCYLLHDRITKVTKISEITITTWKICPSREKLNAMGSSSHRIQRGLWPLFSFRRQV